MKPGTPMYKVLIALRRYMCFFILIAFLITCCMLLFLSALSETVGIVWNEESIRMAAIATFLNVVFLSLVGTMLDTIRRKYTVERPVKQILTAAEQITKGDYSVRIPPLHNVSRADGLDQIIDCFNKMAEELSGVETLQTDFIANVSHELKTPLAVMQNYGTLLQQSDLSEEERIHYAKIVSDTGRQLAGLVTNILKLNKLENQQIYPAVQTYDLNAQLCECLLAFESVWEQKQIDLDIDLDENVYVNTDSELLSLVWNNLLSNAFKFTDEGGRVSVVMKQDAEHVIVQISDTGCGIPPEVGAYIFDKFYQGDTSHATEGNGLGLALVKRVIDIMRGEITVESEVGKGSVFTVKLRSV